MPRRRDRFVCGCCGRIAAMREDHRWRVYLRRGGFGK
jgi:hypothetical protein